MRLDTNGGEATPRAQLAKPRNASQAPPVAQRSARLAPPRTLGSGSFSTVLAKRVSTTLARNGTGTRDVIAAGSRYLGTRYAMGGGRRPGKPQSLDCSSFVARAYADATGGRTKLTAQTDAMYRQTTAIDAGDARPGDLVFYRGHDPGQPGVVFPHVALYTGNGRILDASSQTGQVAARAMNISASLRPEFRRVAV